MPVPLVLSHPNAPINPTERCGACGVLCNTDEPLFLTVLSNNYICNSCILSGHWQQCEECDRYYPPESVGSIDGCCHFCFPWADDDSNTHIVHDWSYKPIPVFFKIGIPSNNNQYYENINLYFGIELELELNKTDPLELHKAIKLRNETIEHFYFKYDGSLNNGIEIVSHPMSYNFLLSFEYLWNNAIDTANHLGCTSKLTNRCGMHIHTSLDAWSRLQIYKLLKFLQKNEDFILYITNRTHAQLKRWAYLDEPTYLAKKAYHKSQLGNDRHSAVNITSTTVELRIFNGTLNKIEFWRNIQIAKCLYDFTSNQSIKDMDANILYNYVCKHHNKYPLFYDKLKSKKNIISKGHQTKESDSVLSV